MTYQSVTTWQADDYEVEVRYGFFSTPAEAAVMARSGIERIVVDALGLWVDLSDGTRAPVRTDAFTFRRLREESRSAGSLRALTCNDFEAVDMGPEEMRKELAMRNFGSQSYGVVDAAGQPVGLPPHF